MMGGDVVMRIAMLTINYLPFVGGVPISIQRLSQGLRSLGNEVYIFAPTYENEVEEDYVIRYRSFDKRIANGCVIPNCMDPVIKKAFEENSFDLIHVHHPMLIGNTALHLGKKYGIPVVYTYHTRYEQYLHHLKPYHKLLSHYENEENKVIKQIEEKVIDFSENKFIPYYIKRFTKQCDMVFAPTTLMKYHLINQGATTDIEVLPTGLNEAFFQKNQVLANEIRKTYGGNDKFLLCTVSRLEKEKNLSFLLQGMKRLKEKLGEHFHLLIIGDGTKRAELEQSVARLGLDHQVTFVGTIPQEEISHYYEACDLFVFSSKSETQGIVLLEAMAAGLPVVAIKASGVNDIVMNHVNGYTTNEDVEEFSEEIRKLLLDKERYEIVSSGANKTANEYRSISVSKKAEEFYKEAIVMKGESYASKRLQKKQEKKDLVSYHSLIS